tara:strand:- start:158 stop:958 length:801 start_codon:yes stop_codon:yes gene_type:complete
MPFALIGFFLATKSYGFEWLTMFQVILCMIFARSAAMAFNRYVDRKIDKKNKRTSNKREIPNGQIIPKDALIFVIINSLLFIATTYFINRICLILSPIALTIILSYSYTKRFTSLCHLILGIGLALSPIGSYLAVSGKFSILPILFSLVVLFWVSGFDIIYSLQDQEFDKKQKLYSIPVLIGKKKSLNLVKVLHLITILLLLIIGNYYDFGPLYWIGFLFFSSLIIYQNSLVKYDDLSKIDIAFFTTNGIASILFGISVIADIVLT